MKNYINKSAKRILSLALALIMLAGCLFTANIGVGITAAAETDPYADWDNVQYWDGTVLSNFDGWTPVNGKYVIDTAAKLQLACSATKAEYWRADNVNTFGKSFVIDENVDAFIMQPKEVVDKLGIAAFVEASGAEETRELFEDKFAAIDATPVNWSTNTDNGIFAGNFDGSGVPIYGVYADGAAKNIQNVGFFPMTEGSNTKKGESGAPATDENGIDIKNLVIKNCYFKGFRRVGILTGGGWYNGGGMLVDGCVNVDSCIFANCYVLGQNYVSSTNSLYATTINTNEMGLLCGGTAADPVKLSNSLVYGNKTEYDFYTDSNSDGIYEVTTTKDEFNWAFRQNTNNGTNYGSVKNSIILDAVVNNLQADNTDYCQNVYSNTYTTYNTVTQMVDRESVKGAHGRYYMEALGWDSAWWAIENEYPTPIKPSDSYVSVAAKEFEGSGTEADPYLIYCAKQLDTMVTEGGIRNSVRSYYKVADSVKEIYLNGDIKTKAEAIALYNNNSGTFNNWNHGTTAFEGHFDGNGVTIYGMISSNRGGSGNVGFVSKLGITEDCATSKTASIKNINFVGAYVNSSSVAAVVTSGVVGYKETTADGETFVTDPWGKNDVVHYSYISNISVRDSYIYANNSSFSDEATSHNGSAAGILALSETPDHIVISNCLYDGGSCVLEDGDTSNSRAKSAKAGIVTMYSGGNEFTIENCVSINEYAIPMVSGITNYRYGSATTSALQFNTVYGKLNAELDITSTTYDKLANCYGIEADKTTFSMLDMPQLNWGGAWNLVEYNGRMIPMPKTSHETVDAYSTQLAKQNDGKGANQVDDSRHGGYTKGTYGMYEEFLGSGTEADPYIISNALDLARAIACGGKDITTKLYYKLSCDIDIGASWITDAVTVDGKYQYVPFEGHIDGDGHTIYNLVSIGGNAGLIPTIVGGASIKNLHIRNSNIIDTEGDGGAFFGKYQSDGNGTKVTLEGCSFEGAGVEGGVDYLVGNFAASIVTNSYAIGSQGTRYYQYYEYDSSTGAVTSSTNTNVPTADYTGDNADTAVWYKGGKGDCKPQLVNRAKAMTEVDISGYGDNDYDANDLVSLRQRLLNNPDYANVYGDVSRNGVTNLSDLALLGRQLVGTYNKIADGFWRNAALGNIVIYYGENDNYDFARKLELALEDEFGKDVKKVVVTSKSDFSNVSWGNSIVNGNLYVHKNDICTDGNNYYKLSEDATTGAINPVVITDAAEIAKYALDGKCQIVVGDIDIANGTDYTSTISDVNNYQISVDEKNAAVWLQGGSFTAVEQATLDFINNSNPDANYLHSGEGALNSEKVAITVDGEPYYYAWGDEFNGDALNKDPWNYDVMHNESSQTPQEDYKFTNLEVAFPDDIEKLYTVNDGKLTIWRGYYAATGSDIDWGYKYLGTQKTGSNNFGGTVDSDDNYVTAGKIATNKSLLVKQGYLEMKATYPEDGHAFPCWWLLGYSGGTISNNSRISNSLFSKVFKLNNIAAYSEDGDTSNAWDGTNTLNSSVPSTFKYQLPNSSYEIDIAELMQGGSNGGDRDYKTANFTFHKFYGNGVYEDNGVQKIKFINWDNLLAGGNAYLSATFTNGFRVGKVTGSVESKSMTATTVSEFLYNTQLTGSSSGLYTNYTSYNGEMLDYNDSSPYFSGTPGTVTIEGGQEYIFGVKWDATDTTALYTFTVTKVGETTPITTVKVADDIVYNEDSEDSVTTLLSALSNLETDQQTANQYMYMLIDNTYYTANDSGSVYSDLLAQDSSNPKTATMEIDYVRVYQEKRDIVTPDTEEFNNGNHFGY
ncbi:MAG: hypothetical protein IJN22_05295 [Clostridia bacterium]|nr:hypothetical protein [Clostridia bacterium]